VIISITWPSVVLREVRQNLLQGTRSTLGIQADFR
jgi:hypothetical protein